MRLSPRLIPWMVTQMARSRRINPLARPPLSPPTPGHGGSRRQRAAFLAIAPMLVLVGIARGFFGRRLIDVGDDGKAAADAPVFPLGGELRQELHDHADFALFVRGRGLDFDDPEFLSTEDRELSRNVHLHAPRTNAVHIHREQAIWDEFFTSLGMELDDARLALSSGEKLCIGSDETLRFFVNGARIDSLRFQNLTDLDRALISFGADDDASTRQQLDAVTDEACVPGEQCQARIDPNNKDEDLCTRTGTTCVN